jgi:glycosyltransferase involved in cell wall biosynthesis
MLSDRPHDHQVLSLFIALCLKQQDYVAAMAAIEKMAAAVKPDAGLIDAGLSVRAKIDSTVKNHSPNDEILISLCMIVKDESSRLGACLHAVKKLVNEIIVVDTGSSDRTLDLARLFGARTFSSTWQNDFSVARNLSLEKASGDWILILDADEIIASEDHVVLRSLLRQNNEKPVAFSIETRNYTHIANTLGWQANNGTYPLYEAGLGWFPSRKVRLFRRTDGARFCYPVHELVEPSLTASGIAILECPVPIHHYGHLNESKNKKKAETYFHLGYAKLEQLRSEPTAVRELAVQAGQLEYWSQSLELWRQFLKIWPDHAEAFVNIASVYWQLGNYEEALRSAERAKKIDPELKEAHYNIAVSLIFLYRAAEAVAILQDLLKTHRGYLAAGFMLAAAFGCIGDRTRSQSLWKVLSETPAGQAIDLAVEDLIKRLRSNGQETYAKALESAAGV